MILLIKYKGCWLSLKRLIYHLFIIQILIQLNGEVPPNSSFKVNFDEF